MTLHGTGIWQTLRVWNSYIHLPMDGLGVHWGGRCQVNRAYVSVPWSVWDTHLDIDLNWSSIQSVNGSPLH